MNKRIHKKRANIHAKKRLNQRYKKTLNKHERRYLISLIESNKTLLIKKEKYRTTHQIVLKNGEEYYVVYDSHLRTIITFLTKEMVSKEQENSHEQTNQQV